MAEGDGLENRFTLPGNGGSNPSCSGWPLANRAFEQVSRRTGELTQMRSTAQLSLVQIWDQGRRPESLLLRFFVISAVPVESDIKLFRLIATRTYPVQFPDIVAQSD